MRAVAGGRGKLRKLRVNSVPFPGFELLTLHTAKWLISLVDLSGWRIGETVKSGGESEGVGERR